MRMKLIVLALTLSMTPAAASGITTLLAPPGFGATDTFFTVLPGEEITIDFSEPQHWLGFYWIDAQPWNYVTFYGDQITQFNSQGAGMTWYTNAFVEFTFTAPGTAQDFNSVTFTTQFAPFYFGNVTAVPEPATWALMLIAFAFFGLRQFWPEKNG